MTKNTPEAMQKIAENLLLELYKNDNCDEWECSQCPFQLEQSEEDPRYGVHNCGWLLLKSAVSKILRN